MWLLQQPTLIIKRKKAIIPAVAQRQVLADALSRYLGQLGLARKGLKLLPPEQSFLSCFGPLQMCLIPSRRKADAWESRSRKSGQDDKWSFCLTAGTLCPANQERP